MPGHVQRKRSPPASGFDHLLAYDHVLGADPNRPGGWTGAYNSESAFYEPFALFAYLAAIAHRLNLPRLKDWMALLSFEVSAGRMACYVPPLASEKWRRRFGFMFVRSKESTTSRTAPLTSRRSPFFSVKRVPDASNS